MTTENSEVPLLVPVTPSPRKDGTICQWGLNNGDGSTIVAVDEGHHVPNTIIENMISPEEALIVHNIENDEDRIELITENVVANRDDDESLHPRNGMTATIQELMKILKYIDEQLNETPTDFNEDGENQANSVLEDSLVDIQPKQATSTEMTQEKPDMVEHLVRELENLGLYLSNAYSDASVVDGSLRFVSQRLSTSARNIGKLKNISCQDPSTRAMVQTLLNQQYQSLLKLECELNPFGPSVKRIIELEQALSSKALELESAQKQTRSLEEILNRLERTNSDLENDGKGIFQGEKKTLTVSPMSIPSYRGDYGTPESALGYSPTNTSEASCVTPEQLKGYTMEIAKLRRINSDHKFKHDTLEKIVQDQQEWMLKLETQLEESSNAVSELEEARAHSKALEDILKRNEDGHQALKMEIHNLTQELEESRPSLAILERQLEISKAKEASIRAELAESNDRNLATASELEGKQLHLQYMQGTVASLQRNLVKAQNEVLAAKSEKDHQRKDSTAAFESQLRDAKIALEDGQKQIDGLKAKLISSQTRIKELTESLSIKTSELEDTCKRAKFLEGRVEQLETQNRELDEMTLPKIEELEAELELARQKEGSIQTRLAQAENQNSSRELQLVANAEQIKELGLSVSSLDKQLNELRAQFNFNNEESEQQLLRIAQLENELKESTANLNSTQENLEAFNDKVKILEESLATKLLELKTAQKHSANLEAKVDWNEQTCCNLRNELDASNKGRDLEKLALEKQLEEAREQDALLRNKLATTTAKRERSRVDLGAKNEQIKSLRASIAKLYLQLAKLREEIVSNLQDKNALEEMASDLTRKLNDRTVDARKKQSMIDALTNQHIVDDSRIRELNSELEEFKRRFKSINERSARIEESRIVLEATTAALIREQQAVADLKHQIEDSKNVEVHLRDKLADAIDLNVVKDVEITAKGKLVEELQTNVDSLKAKLSKAREDLSSSGDTITEPRERIAALEVQLIEASDSLKEAERKFDAMKIGFEGQVSELRLLLHEKHGVGDRPCDLSSVESIESSSSDVILVKNEEVNDSIDQLIQAKLEPEPEICVLQRQIEENKEMETSLRDKLANVIDLNINKLQDIEAKDKLIATLESSVVALKQKLEEACSKLLEINEARDAQQTEVIGVQNQIKVSSCELNDNNTKMEKPEGGQGRITSNMEEMLQRKDIEMESLRRQLQEILQAEDYLRSQLAEALARCSSTANEMELKERSIGELEIRLREAQELVLVSEYQAQEHKSELGPCQNSCENREEMEAAREDKALDIEFQCESTSDEWERAFLEAQDELLCGEHEGSVLKLPQTEFEEMLEEKTRTIEEMSCRNRSLREVIRDLQNAKLALLVTVNNLTRESENAVPTRNDAQTELESLRAIENSLRGEVEAGNHRQGLLELDVERKSKLIKDLEASVLNLQKELKESVAAIDELKNSMNERVQHLLSSLSNKNRELENALNYSESLEERLEQLEKSYQNELKESDSVHEEKERYSHAAECDDANPAPLWSWTEENMIAFLNSKNKDKRIRKLKGSVSTLNKRLSAKTVELALSQNKSRRLEESNLILERRIQELTLNAPCIEANDSPFEQDARCLNVTSLAVGSAAGSDQPVLVPSDEFSTHNLEVELLTNTRGVDSVIKQSELINYKKNCISEITSLLAGARDLMSNFCDMVANNMDIAVPPAYFADWQLLVFHFVSPILTAKRTRIAQEYRRQ